MPDPERDMAPIEVLYMGIQREKDAYAFYSEMAGRVTDPATKEMLKSMALEELGHQRKLENWLQEHFQREM